MHNPAWRPARLHTERLASIQHHFIDEHPETSHTGIPGITHSLPVLMAVAAEHPANALQPQDLVDALTRQLNMQTSAATEHPDWQLEAIPAEHGERNADQGLILVFATANIEGIRLAYSGIKKLSASPSPRVGVLFSGARDEDIAHRCQELLASGVSQFLGLRLHELGHLSSPGPDFSADLARLAREINRLWPNHS